MGTKVNLWDISISNPKMMVPLMKIKLQEETRPLKLIEQVIYSRKLILILDSDFVELPITDTYSKGSIFLFHKQQWSAPRGYALLNETFISEIFSLQL